MIKHDIPTVHRFIPFTFIVACAISFCAPIPALAACPTYLYTDAHHGGSPMGTVGTLGTFTGNVFSSIHNASLGYVLTVSDCNVSATEYNSGILGPFSLDMATAIPTMGTGAGEYVITSTGGNGFCFFTWDGSNIDDSSGCVYTPPPDPCASGDTKICLTTPANGITVATTSLPIAIGADVYVDPDDFADNMVIYGSYHKVNQYNNDLALGIDTSFLGGVKSGGDFKIPIEADGYTSTTTVSEDKLHGGAYLYDVKILRPKPRLVEFLNIDLFFDTLAATTTVWAVGTTSPQDLHSLNPRQQISLTGTSTPVLVVPDTCSPFTTTFNIDGCIQYWLTPDPASLAATFQNFQSGFLTHAPWGYVNRLLTIMTASTTSALPTWTANIATGENATSSLTFDMQDTVSGGATLLSGITDREHGLTMRQIIEPWIQLLIAISALIIIFHDLMAMGHHTKRS